MSIFYLDTSVIVKRYRNEEGTAFVDLLFDTVIGSKDHSLTTSTLSILEFIAAMRRAQKGNVITQDHFENAVFIFNRELNHISLRPVSEEILARAIDVVMNHAMRTADNQIIIFQIEFLNNGGEKGQKMPVSIPYKPIFV